MDYMVNPSSPTHAQNQETPYRAGVLILKLSQLARLLNLPLDNVVRQANLSQFDKELRLLIVGPAMPLVPANGRAPIVHLVYHSRPGNEADVITEFDVAELELDEEIQGCKTA
jgi:hypothetical protein